ncbi:MAG: aminoglycoside phosphotransferase family protein [Oscillospiraceae bacterium]|nr:aminoglycoside phosphotransferase family protein [Oscillospiraceae bacterium]
MYSAITRGSIFIDRLRGFIEENYPIRPVAIAPAARGFYGETWRVDAPQGCFFAKLDCSPHQNVYERSFPVIEHMCSHGIDFISKILKTREGGHCTHFEDGVLGLFDWIEGENQENDSTKPHEYDMLAKIYTVDTKGLAIPREDFSAREADRFFDRRERVQDEGILALLEAKWAEIERCAQRLRYFSGICEEDDTGFVHGKEFAITHGDAGGNVLVFGENYHIIDWDDPRLAPPERDAWFWMHRPWAMRAFHGALRENHIEYTLRPVRLAYYCYYMYFFYLNEILDAHFALGGLQDYLADYLHGWMNDNRDYAERSIP